MRTHSLFLIPSLLACLLLSACVGNESRPTRYYLIDPMNYDQPSNSTGTSLSIEVIDLHLPQYLERFHIATRAEGNRLHFSESHQWAENLRKNLLRTLTRNLSQLLDTIDIGTPLNRSASLPDYRLQVYIEQFERDEDGIVSLIARWQVSGLENPEPIGIYAAELQGESTIKGSNYDEIVMAMQTLFGQLSERIAGTILEQEN